MLLGTRRNRQSDPLSLVPARAQPHRAGVQRADSGDDDVGLRFPEKRFERPESGPESAFSEKIRYL